MTKATQKEINRLRAQIKKLENESRTDYSLFTQHLASLAEICSFAIEGKRLSTIRKSVMVTVTFNWEQGVKYTPRSYDDIESSKEIKTFLKERNAELLDYVKRLEAFIKAEAKGKDLILPDGELMHLVTIISQGDIFDI